MLPGAPPCTGLRPSRGSAPYGSAPLTGLRPVIVLLSYNTILLQYNTSIPTWIIPPNCPPNGPTNCQPDLSACKMDVSPAGVLGRGAAAILIHRGPFPILGVGQGVANNQYLRSFARLH